jgi:hypothetical protein
MTNTITDLKTVIPQLDCGSQEQMAKKPIALLYNKKE